MIKFRSTAAMALLLASALSTNTGGVLAAPEQPTARATALPAGVRLVTSVEGITEYQLENGLRVLLFPDQSKQTTTVNITYLVGSRNENYGETGMAHLLEHLVFKGTPNHPNIPQELTAHGARPNGTTWFDRTNYYETFQASDENLAWALDLEADRMVNSFIKKEDLDSEMTVVRNEFEAGENSPFSVLLERVMSTAFLWHNYGNSTIGARADLENVPIDRLKAFYQTYYQPDNAILLVAGKFDEAKVIDLVQKKFGPIPRPTRVIQKTYTADPVQDGERSVTLRRTGDTQVVQVAYHIPAGSHPDFPAVDLLASVIGDTPSGRLHKALVEPKKAASVFGFGFQLREPGVVLFGAEVAKDQSLDEARDTLIRTIESIASNPPTVEEVNRARQQALKGIELTLNSSERVGLQLSEWMAMGDWRLFYLHRDRLKQVTPDDVKRVASAYIKPSNRTLGLFIPTDKPDRAEIPATPDVTPLVANYKGGDLVVAGEEFEPSPGNIEARTAKPDLSSGLKLSMLPKKTRGGSVVATMTLRFGDEKSLMNRSQAGQFAASMLMRGTKKHTRQQIQDEFDRLKARVFVFGGPIQVGVSIETVREHLPEVLKLVAEVLREPEFSANEFEQLKQEQLTGIESFKREPDTIASIAYSRYQNPYPKGDVRYTATIDETIEDIKASTLDDVKRFYSDFYGASNGEIAVVGDFDAKQVESMLRDQYGSWKSPRPYARIPSLYIASTATTKIFEAPDKANAFFIGGMNLKLRDDDPDYPALVLGNYMLGGGFLNSRLATRIRQKEGISYGVGSSIGASSLDEKGSFTVYAIYAPQNAKRLEDAFREEIDRMLKDGFTADEVAAAKSGYLQSRIVSRAQDSSVARTLASYQFYNRSLVWDADFERKLEALTPDQILTALRKHIDPSKITIMRAGDFAKAAAVPAK